MKRQRSRCDAESRTEVYARACKDVQYRHNLLQMHAFTPVVEKIDTLFHCDCNRSECLERRDAVLLEIGLDLAPPHTSCASNESSTTANATQSVSSSSTFAERPRDEIDVDADDERVVGSLLAKAHWKRVANVLDPQSGEWKKVNDMEKAVKRYRLPYNQEACDFATLHKWIGELDILEQQRTFTVLNYARKVVAKHASSMQSGSFVLLPRIQSSPTCVQGVQLLREDAFVLVCAVMMSAIPAREHETIADRRWCVASATGLYALHADNDRFQSQSAKTKFILHYIERMMKAEHDEPRPSTPGVVRVIRKRLGATHAWSNLDAKLAQVRVHGAGRSIEDFPDALQADFANKYIGGGILTTGAVQEEIRFALCPELLVSSVLCEVMADDEAILLEGAEQFSTYKGYRRTLERDGDYSGADVAERSQLIAFDASYFRLGSVKEQFTRESILRELNKAYVAFIGVEDLGGVTERGPNAGAASSSVTADSSSSPDLISKPPCSRVISHSEIQRHGWTNDYGSDKTLRPVATGNWGCGAFHGDLELKFVLQWLAASAARREMDYCTFDDPGLPADRVERFVATVSKAGFCVNDLFRALPQNDQDSLSRLSVFDFIEAECGKSNSNESGSA